MPFPSLSSPMATFATLRALHLVVGDALDDIQRVFSLPDAPSPTSQCSSPVSPLSPDSSPAPSPFPATPPASFPPTPLSATFPSPHADSSLDYPSPDSPYVSDSPAEKLALHPDAVAAASRIVAACGQIATIVHKPFLSLCDAITGYNLPACMRLVEHLHIAEILRDAEQNKTRLLPAAQITSNATVDPKVDDIHTSGLHIADITDIICSYAGHGYVDPCHLVHVLRLLSTHHIFRETSPDTFALTRVASLLDTGKTLDAVFTNPETKYDNTDGTAAYVAMVTDELFKSAAYLTEAFTGARLPASMSAPHTTSFVRSASSTPSPSTSRYPTNDLAPCPPTTRSSSILTHILYPDNGETQLLTESREPVALSFLPTDILIPYQPLATGSKVPRSPRLNPIESPTRTKTRCVRPADAPKLDKLLAFNLAFHTDAPFFEWLENGGQDPLGGTGRGAGTSIPTSNGSIMRDDIQSAVSGNHPKCEPQKSFRLERFSRAMMGTAGWEAPKAILSGFDWHSLPKGSTIIDVGGGIGSTTMVLARALNDPMVDPVRRPDGAHAESPQINTAGNNDANLRFIVQDRPVVTALGIEAWHSKCPEMLGSRHVTFQDQDFFDPQPPLEPPHLLRYPAVYLLRVVLHDWPDEFARRILINLRVASNADTRLLIAEHVLPLACADEGVSDHANANARKGSRVDEWTVDTMLAHVDGAERALMPPPMLPNMGKASANAYWMDLTMHITLNGKERTLREFCALTLAAGWRVTRMTRPEGSLFAYLVCEPIPLPDDAQAIYNAVVLSSELSTVVAVPPDEPACCSHAEASRYKQLPAVPLLPSPVLERSSSRCGTPTFGSRTQLPKDEDLSSPTSRGTGAARKWLKSKGLGVRSVMMHKAEKEKQKEERVLQKGISGQDNSDIQNAAPASSSHVRVWWKKSPQNSASNSSTAIHELSGDAPGQRPSGRGRRGTPKSNDSPSTPSPRTSPIHQKWPSLESAVMSMPEVSPPLPRPRRPSVASITRKLSFATFRRPSFADITEPLPTPPPSATLADLAPAPALQGDRGRRLKHLPSLPTLGSGDAGMTDELPPAVPRRPSLSFAGQVPSPRPVPTSAPPRRPEGTESPKQGILKSRSSPGGPSGGSKPDGSSPRSAERTTPMSPRQRRVTLSNSTAVAAAAAAGGNVPSDPEGLGLGLSSEAKPKPSVPSIPRMPRRLSIPMLRRKRSHAAMQEGEGQDAQAIEVR